MIGILELFVITEEARAGINSIEEILRVTQVDT